MKKPVLIVLAVFAGFVVLCCGGVAIFLPNALKKVTGEFQDAEKSGSAAVLAFGSSWDVSELTSRATPQFTAVLAQPASTAIWNTFKDTYGPYKSGSSQITSFNTSSTTSTGTRTQATYVNDAVFEKRTAKLTMTMVRSGAQWMVDGIQIDGVSLGN